MIKKISEQDKKDWKKFLDSNEKLKNKDNDIDVREIKKILKKKSILAKKYLYRYDYNTNLKKYAKILKDNID